MPQRIDPPAGPAGTVPDELRDHLDETWLDPELFARWCDRNGIERMPEGAGEFPTTRWGRFHHGRREWARLHRISGPSGLIGDAVALDELGIANPDALDCARARAELNTR